MLSLISGDSDSAFLQIIYHCRLFYKIGLVTHDIATFQVICFIHSSLYMLIPYCSFILPPSPLPFATANLVSMPVNLFVLYIHLLVLFLDFTYN